MSLGEAVAAARRGRTRAPGLPRGYQRALGPAFLLPLYDPIQRWLLAEGRVKHAFARTIQPPPGGRLLDLGCGTGTLALWIEACRPDLEIVAVDGDPAVLARAARKLRAHDSHVRLQRVVAPALPFPPASFDAVTGSLFFHHLDRRNVLRTLRVIRRLLVPDGMLHVLDYAPGASPWGRILSPLLRCFEHTRDHLDGRFQEILCRAGFVVQAGAARKETPAGTLGMLVARPAPEGARAFTPRAMRDCTPRADLVS